MEEITTHYGKNTIYNSSIIYTNHASQRLAQRDISAKAIELTKKFGTEIINNNIRTVTIDFEACTIAADQGINLYPYYSTTIVVSPDNVLKTVYLKDID